MSTLSRRALVRALAVGAAGGIAGGLALPRHLLGAAPDHDVDDVETSRAKVQLIGLQLYTVRRALSADLEGTIAGIAAAGVREVEFADYYNRTPEQWTTLLKQHKLTAPATHVGLPATDEGWKPHFERAGAMGHKWVIVPAVGAAYRGSVDAFKRLADRLNAAGTLAKQAGVRMGYHNHDFEFATLGDTNGYEVLMGALDATLVDMELDIYWAVKAGQTPLAMIERWPGRFACCHVKDAGPPPTHTMMDVGAGAIKFGDIFKMSKKAGFKHYYIEHDQPADPLASVRASASYLAKLRF